MNSSLPRLLAVDDDKRWLEQVPVVLEDDCVVEGVATIDEGLQLIESQFYDIILLDLNFDGDTRTGLDVFRRIQAADKGADVIAISAETDYKKIIELFNAGVSRYISKPATPDDVRGAVRELLGHRTLRREALEQVAKNQDGQPLIGSSLPMQKLRNEIDRIVKTGVTDVLLLGETGTGKEVVANLIAYLCDPSARLISKNCAAISDGLAESELFGHVKGAFTGADQARAGAFEMAAGGFVFLDELGEMPATQQAKLLRVIQERKVARVGSAEEIKVNFRTIAATNVDIDEAVAKGKFREDLLYRIAKEKVHIPALRERLEDIPELVHYFLAQTPAQRRKSISPEALVLLQAYHWPGNIRQLRAVVDNIQSRTTDKVIRDRDVCQALPDVAKISPASLTPALVGRYGAHLITNERRRYEKALVQANFNRGDAARLLGISRATFFRKAKDLGLVNRRSQG